MQSIERASGSTIRRTSHERLANTTIPTPSSRDERGIARRYDSDREPPVWNPPLAIPVAFYGMVGIVDPAQLSRPSRRRPTPAVPTSAVFGVRLVSVAVFQYWVSRVYRVVGILVEAAESQEEAGVHSSSRTWTRILFVRISVHSLPVRTLPWLMQMDAIAER